MKSPSQTHAHDVLDDAALDRLFRTARTANGWLPTPVTDVQLRAIYELAKWGPTSVNCQPARLKFIRSPEAKDKLKPFLNPGNVEKTMAAPVTAIIGMDMAFHEHLPAMFPHNAAAKSWFEGKDAFIEATAFRNASLQGGYLIMACRALGLDCGAMSGFDAAGLDAAFWAGTKVKTNFLLNIGYADPARTFARSPRFDFDAICEIA